jgi:two-component system cell cycle response regulator CtrA
MDAQSAEPIQSSIAIAIRLADEGIPIRAIARATSLPSSDIYELLRDAVATGLIVELPKDDWPPGSNRGSRVVFHGTPLEQEEALKIACARKFKTSPLEAGMLALMLRRDQVTKEQLHVVITQKSGKEDIDQKMVDVMICKLRKKLKPFGLVIETMWGMGYLITPASRELAVQMLVSSEPNNG